MILNYLAMSQNIYERQGDAKITLLQAVQRTEKCLTETTFVPNLKELLSHHCVFHVCRVHPPAHPPFCQGIVPPTKFPKKGGLTGSQFLEGFAGKEGVTFFRGERCSFYIKNQVKCKIFNKSLQTKLFSVITKNLNCKILTNNSQLFLKDGMGLRMKNLNIMEVY